MSWRDAISQVLKTESKAMHYADIAAEIQRQGLRASFGATPASSVYTTIYNSMKEGANAPFVKVGMGEFMLREGRDNGVGIGRRHESGSAESEEVAEAGGIIRAFGMFWRRDWVHWTSKPRLMGQQQEGADAVDFGEQKGVYLLHDGREVIYVGRMTEKRLATRLLEHTRDRLNGRWDRFSWFGLLDVTDRGTLSPNALAPISEDDIVVTLEALLIEGLEPRQNRKRGDAFRAVEYIQAEDPELARKNQKRFLDEIGERLRQI